MSRRLTDTCAVQVNLWEAKVTILQDHGIVERHESLRGIGWRVEVGPKLVQGKTRTHACGCGGRVDLPKIAAKSRSKKIIKKSIVGTVGQLGGVGILGICRCVLSQSAVTDDEIGGDNIVRLVLIDHMEISDRWTLAADAAADGRHGEGAGIDSGLGHLQELVAIAVGKLAEDYTVQTIDAFPGSRSSQSQAIAVGAKPASDRWVIGQRHRDGSDEVLSNNVSLLDNKRVVEGNVPRAVIDGALDERRSGKGPLVTSGNIVWRCQSLSSQRIGGNGEDTVLSERKACKQGSGSEDAE